MDYTVYFVLMSRRDNPRYISTYNNIMDMIEVKSSNVKAIGHDSSSGDMHVLYKNGLYLWTGVTQADFNKLKKSKSKGSHLHNVIEKKYGVGKRISEHTTTDDNAGNARKGFLVEHQEITQPNNQINVNTPEAHCPKCQSPAAGFIPPIMDERYLNRMQIERGIINPSGDEASNPTDEEVHMRILKSNGGYVDTCKCGTSFFVSAKLAKLKR